MFRFLHPEALKNQDLSKATGKLNHTAPHTDAVIKTSPADFQGAAVLASLGNQEPPPYLNETKELNKIVDLDIDCYEVSEGNESHSAQTIVEHYPSPSQAMHTLPQRTNTSINAPLPYLNMLNKQSCLLI